MTKPLNIGQVLVERLKKFTENMDSKPWTTLLGKPQGNEMVWRNSIIRQTHFGPPALKYTTLWTTDSPTNATIIFDAWMKENT